ncbi:hypothetical protein V0288_23510 [Pannus brasiliensis CCIBt3594]|uniref:Uncharacterized protein n=1 Tax=Pannus brasiliensis CCIBt3594 TaxID=1427578 RepID=A0AAW9QQR6_9CHRO
MTLKPTPGPARSPVSPETASFPRPSVPISVYRDLARELQATRGRVDFLISQNERLVKDNRQLRQEIERIVERGQHLQRILQNLDETRERDDPSFVIPARARVVTPPGRSSRPREIQPATPPAPVVLSPESRKDLSRDGWRIALAVVAVVLTSGVGAFWLVSSARR